MVYSNNYRIRFASIDDVSGMLNIYSPIVINTHTSFEHVVPTEREFSDRLTQYMDKLPWIVIVEEEQILGYAYATQLRGRISYSWSAELSVYVHPEYSGKGIGKRLYKTLIDLLQLQGVRNYYAVVALPNKVSEEFHVNFGFNKIGVFEKTGYKNRWVDIAWYYLRMGSDDAPKTLLSMKELSIHPKTAEILRH